MGGGGGCRVGEVRAGTTSPMPNHMGTVTSKFSEIQHFKGYLWSEADLLQTDDSLLWCYES